jgi:transcriptional regulator with XRE-family HTH domain
MKTKEREAARVLRADQGLSVKEIAKTLDVSTSTVSRWVRDIELTYRQRQALRAHARGDRVQAGKRNSERARLRRAAWQQEGRRRAREKRLLHMAGCMLFWAEGSRSRNSVYFTNSDPAMVRLFLEFLVSEVGIERHAVRIDLNLFADHLREEARIQRHWLDSLALPARCLRGSTVNVYSRHSARKRLNCLPYGTCRLSLHSTRIVQHLFGAIQEYGGFERPEWLE